jgi:6-phosphogluconolactonase
MIRKVVKQFSAACCLISFFIFLPGCGAPHSSQPEFLYISGQNEIATFSINRADGALTALPATSGPNNATVITKTMAASPDAKFLYDYDAANNVVVGFSIDQEHGALTAISGSPFSANTFGFVLAPGVDIPGGIITDPKGQFLYLANIVGFSVFDRDRQSGALTAVASPTFQLEEAPFGAVTDAAGKFLYSNNLTASVGNIGGFTIDPANGALTELPNSPFPVNLQGNSLGTHLLVSKQFLFRSSLLDNAIEAWSIDSTTGNLVPVPGSPFPTGAGAIDMAMDPSGRFLYVTNLGSASISAYNMNATTGTLIPLQGSPFSIEDPASSLTIDGTGQFLYATISKSSVIGYRINPSTGTLSALNQGPVPVSSTLSAEAQMIIVKP